MMKDAQVYSKSLVDKVVVMKKLLVRLEPEQYL